MPTDIQAPSIAYIPLLPMLIVFGVAVLGVLVEAFVDAPRRRVVQVSLGVAGLLGSLGAVCAVEAECPAWNESVKRSLECPTPHNPLCQCPGHTVERRGIIKLLQSNSIYYND